MLPLKHLRKLRHVSILIDNHQGVDIDFMKMNLLLLNILINNF